MKQLFFFDEPVKQQKTPVNKLGRPHTLAPKKVFRVLESIKKQISNKEIIKTFNLSERSFFRIKKGDYDHLLKQYLDEELQNFSLDFTD